ncbi:hypothetical protein HI972_004949, partial [Salmonella enterica]|nr:hypothetical protein [Salmonella enterica]
LACISGPLLPVPSSGEYTGNPIVILNAMMVMAPNIRWHSCQNGLATDNYDICKSVAKENDRIINTGCWSQVI